MSQEGKSAIDTKDMIKINKTEALQSFTKLMIVLSLSVELVQNTAKQWEIFFKGYPYWLGQTIKNEDGYKIQSYKNTPQLGL